MQTRTVVVVLASLVLTVGLSLLTRSIYAQVNADALVISQLKKAGSNVEKPHPIDFFLYFPNRDAAERFATKAQAIGFSVKVDRAAQGPQWLALATKTMVPLESELAKIRRNFDAWAEAEKGEYDGWETLIVK